MSVKIAHASIDENGQIKSGKAGDQTGREVCIRTWYKKPWQYVIRFKNATMREKVAYAMERACNNQAIGYDQNERNSLLIKARSVGYDPGKVTSKCETDCSALVTLACIYAGILENALYMSGNSATTTTLRSRLVKTGEVEVFNSTKYTGSDEYLLRGDILLKEGSHVAVAIENGSKAATTPTSTSSTTTTNVSSTVSTTSTANTSFKVKVTVSALNIRSGAGTNYNVVGCIRDNGTYTITKTSGNWGYLKSGAGWINISSSYVKRV